MVTDESIPVRRRKIHLFGGNRDNNSSTSFNDGNHQPFQSKDITNVNSLNVKSPKHPTGTTNYNFSTTSSYESKRDGEYADMISFSQSRYRRVTTVKYLSIIQKYKSHKIIISFIMACFILVFIINTQYIYTYNIDKRSSSIIDRQPNFLRNNQPSSSSFHHHRRHDGIVIAIGTGYSLSTYQQFIGSLRSTGFEGRIILGIESHISPISYQYLSSQQVVMKNLTVTPCIEKYQDKVTNGTNHDGVKERNMCSSSYPEYRIESFMYPIVQDWIKDEEERYCAQENIHHQQQHDSKEYNTQTKCNLHDSILLTSISNVYFQRNPFQVLDEQMETRKRQKKSQRITLKNERENSVSNDNRDITSDGHAKNSKVLYFFEQDDYTTTENSKVATPLYACKSFLWDVPLLSSNIIIGDSSSIFSYVHAMNNEIHEWRNGSSSHSSTALSSPCYDDSNTLYQDIEMAIHNYLFYDGRIFANAFQSRTSLVHFVTRGERQKLKQMRIKFASSSLSARLKRMIVAYTPCLQWLVGSSYLGNIQNNGYTNEWRDDNRILSKNTIDFTWVSVNKDDASYYFLSKDGSISPIVYFVDNDNDSPLDLDML